MADNSKSSCERPTEKQGITLAAAAIANARGMRHGAPPISNILELLDKSRPNLLAEVTEDAVAALKAVGFADLLAALDEAHAGLEFAIARGCLCSGDFVCSPHKALECVSAALAKAGAQ